MVMEGINLRMILINFYVMVGGGWKRIEGDKGTEVKLNELYLWFHNINSQGGEIRI